MADTKPKRGRPPLAPEDRPIEIKLRVPPDVLAAWRGSGKGWQTRMIALLRAEAPKV